MTAWWTNILHCLARADSQSDHPEWLNPLAEAKTAHYTTLNTN